MDPIEQLKADMLAAAQNLNALSGDYSSVSLRASAGCGKEHEIEYSAYTSSKSHFAPTLIGAVSAAMEACDPTRARNERIAELKAELDKLEREQAAVIEAKTPELIQS